MISREEVWGFVLQRYPLLLQATPYLILLVLHSESSPFPCFLWGCYPWFSGILGKMLYLITECVCALVRASLVWLPNADKNEFQSNTQVFKFRNVGENRDRKASKVKIKLGELSVFSDNYRTFMWKIQHDHIELKFEVKIKKHLF